MTTRRWQPWQTLDDRSHIALRFDAAADAAGGAVYGHRGPKAAIVLSPNLDDPGLRSALAHELVHDERRITSPAATDATMESEEREVRRITARRLVPLTELHELIQRQPDDEPVTALLVASEFDVTIEVAAEALRQLLAQRAPRTP